MLVTQQKLFKQTSDGVNVIPTLKNNVLGSPKYPPKRKVIHVIHKQKTPPYVQTESRKGHKKWHTKFTLISVSILFLHNLFLLHKLLLPGSDTFPLPAACCRFALEVEGMAHSSTSFS